MAHYTVVIEGGPITVQVYPDANTRVSNEDEAYVVACAKVREALASLKGAIQINPQYRKPVKVTYQGDHDPRD